MWTGRSTGEEEAERGMAHLVSHLEVALSRVVMACLCCVQEGRETEGRGASLGEGDKSNTRWWLV